MKVCGLTFLRVQKSGKFPVPVCLLVALFLTMLVPRLSASENSISKLELAVEKAVRDYYSFDVLEPGKRLMGAEQAIENAILLARTEPEEFSRIYVRLSGDESKKPVLDIIVGKVLESQFAGQLFGRVDEKKAGENRTGSEEIQVNDEALHGNGRFLTRDEFARTYYPGYGESEPYYVYRLGRELEREKLETYWREEEKVIQNTVHVKTTVELSMIPTLAGLVKNLKYGQPYKVNVGTDVKVVVDAEFDSKETVRLVANKKYELDRVWFELWRAYWICWDKPDWRLVGKTYQYFEEYTYDEIISGVKNNKAQPVSGN